MLTHSEVTRKARLALITRARRVGKPAKFDGDDDGLRTGASGKDDVPYTPAAKKAAAKAAKSSPAKAPAKAAPAAKRAPRARAREAMAHADEARDRIERWLDTDRSTDPLDGMTQAQLKGAADALGVSVEGRATTPRLKTAILRELADADLPPARRRRQTTTVAASWLPNSPRPLSDLSADQAARAAREGLVDRAEAAAHIRAQADEADRAADQLRRPDTGEPDQPTGRQDSTPVSDRGRQDSARRRDREAARLRNLADRLDPPTSTPPEPEPARVRTREGARGIAGYRQRLREMDDAGLEASLQVLDDGTVPFATDSDRAAARRAVLAEMRRRDRAAQRATEQAQRYEQIRAEQPEVDELTAWALATGQDPDRLAGKMERLGRTSRRQLRRDWEMLVEAELQQAEEATNGQLVNAEGRLRYDPARRAHVSVDPRDFWRRPASYVDRWASEEFQQWAARRGGITTFAAYRAMVEGGGTLRDIRARDRGRYGEAA